MTDLQDLSRQAKEANERAQAAAQEAQGAQQQIDEVRAAQRTEYKRRQHEWWSRLVTDNGAGNAVSEVQRTRNALVDAIADSPLGKALVDHVAAILTEQEVRAEVDQARRRVDGSYFTTDGGGSAPGLRDADGRNIDRIDKFALEVIPRLALGMASGPAATAKAERDLARTKFVSNEGQLARPPSTSHLDRLRIGHEDNFITLWAHKWSGAPSDTRIEQPSTLSPDDRAQALDRATKAQAEAQAEADRRGRANEIEARRAGI